MDRPQPAKVKPGQVGIEARKGKLQGDEKARGEANQPPGHGGDHKQLDNTVVVAGRPQLRQLRRRGNGVHHARPDFVAFPTELSYRTVTRVNVRTSQQAWSWGAARDSEGMSVLWPMTQ